MNPEIKDCKQDDREANGALAPGDYMCRCHNCNCLFSGDKRAFHCADCAYKYAHELFAAEILKKSKDRISDGSASEYDEEIMEAAAKFKIGNVRRVKYDPERHGEVMEAEPGNEIWFWGEELP
jgi:hypothetical protein